MNYKPNKQTQEALLNCATALIEPISDNLTFENTGIDLFIEMYSPLQVGDTFFVEHEMPIEYDTMFNLYGEDTHTTEMVTKKFEVISVEVKKIQYLGEETLQYSPKLGAWCKYEKDFEDWYDKQYGKDSYKANPYVFYITVKEA